MQEMIETTARAMYREEPDSVGRGKDIKGMKLRARTPINDVSS